MEQPFDHPTGQKLLSEVREIFRNKPVWHNRPRPFVFVCGGNPAKRSKKLRSQFLSWAGKRLQQVVLVLAEDAYNYTHAFDPPEAVNLSEFEEIIAAIADCVVLFPESAGSFAELGLFSGHREIRRRILVVNPVSHYPQESFINCGPIATIDASSFLRPSLPITLKNRRCDFVPVGKRLQLVIKRNRRKSLEYKRYKELKPIEKLLVILEMINLFHFLDLDSLEKCLIWTFDSANRREMRPLLSILLGMRFIQFHDDYFVLGPKGSSLLEIDDTQIGDVQARALSHYEKNCPLLWARYLKVRKCLSTK